MRLTYMVVHVLCLVHFSRPMVKNSVPHFPMMRKTDNVQAHLLLHPDMLQCLSTPVRQSQVDASPLHNFGFADV